MFSPKDERRGFHSCEIVSGGRKAFCANGHTCADSFYFRGNFKGENGALSAEIFEEYRAECAKGNSFTLVR